MRRSITRRLLPTKATRGSISDLLPKKMVQRCQSFEAAKSSRNGSLFLFSSRGVLRRSYSGFNLIIFGLICNRICTQRVMNKVRYCSQPFSPHARLIDNERRPNFARAVLSAEDQVQSQGTVYIGNVFAIGCHIMRCNAPDARCVATVWQHAKAVSHEAQGAQALLSTQAFVHTMYHVGHVGPGPTTIFRTQSADHRIARQNRGIQIGDTTPNVNT